MASYKDASELHKHRVTINLTKGEHETLIKTAKEMGLNVGTVATHAFLHGLVNNKASALATKPNRS